MFRSFRKHIGIRYNLDIPFYNEHDTSLTPYLDSTTQMGLVDPQLKWIFKT